MKIYDSASVAAAAFAGAVALVALTGCAQLVELVDNRHEEQFPTYKAAAEGWVGVELPSWIPEDAVDLRNTATNDETVAVIRVTSDSPLPDDCTTEERSGIPSLEADWSTEEWPDRVARCGDYEVMLVDGGWLGWFNAQTEGERPDAS